MQVFIFVLVTHMLACAYWVVATNVGYDDDHNWVPDTSYEQRSFGEKYVYAMHFAILGG